MVVAHKILLSAPVPWIGDLGLGDWGLGLDNTNLNFLYLKCIELFMLEKAPFVLLFVTISEFLQHLHFI